MSLQPTRGMVVMGLRRSPNTWSVQRILKRWVACDCSVHVLTPLQTFAIYIDHQGLFPFASDIRAVISVDGRQIGSCLGTAFPWRHKADRMHSYRGKQVYAYKLSFQRMASLFYTTAVLTTDYSRS